MGITEINSKIIKLGLVTILCEGAKVLHKRVFALLGLKAAARKGQSAATSSVRAAWLSTDQCEPFV